MKFSQVTAVVGALAATALASPAARPASSELSKRQTYQGFATYYSPNGGYGSCGTILQNTDMVVAISEDAPFYDNEFCGKQVTITNVGGGMDNNGVGNTVTATVEDTCPGCVDVHLDCSNAVFAALLGSQQLDPPGVFNITWSFV